MEGGEVCSGKFLAGGILSVFACGARTSSPMDKRKPQFDSARQVGLETLLIDFLMVGCTGVRMPMIPERWK